MVHCGQVVGKAFSILPQSGRMAHAASKITPLTTVEGRREERTHLFVAAVLYAGGRSCPVRIRNISHGGALIEGAAVPEQGASAVLRRGSLESQARVVWKAGGKAGLAFSSIVHIADWMSRMAAPHQARVDEVVRGFRSGTDAAPRETSTKRDAPMQAELHALREELRQLEDGLLGDVILVATHPEIQLLDIALQRIDRMLRALPPS